MYNKVANTNEKSKIQKKKKNKAKNYRDGAFANQRRKVQATSSYSQEAYYMKY